MQLSATSSSRLAGPRACPAQKLMPSRPQVPASRRACMLPQAALGSPALPPPPPRRRRARRGLVLLRRPASSPSSSSSSTLNNDATAPVLFDVHLLLAVARMRATDAFAKEVELLYKPPDEDDDESNEDDDANNDAHGRRVAPFSLLRAAALMTAALAEPQLSYEDDVMLAVEAATEAAWRRLTTADNEEKDDALAFVRRRRTPPFPFPHHHQRPETERLERIAQAVASTLRLDAGLEENAADPFDPRNATLDRDVLRALRMEEGGKTAAAGATPTTGPAAAAVLFAELARRLGAGVALAGPHDRPLLRLFDRAAAEGAPTSADVAAGEGMASAWAETTTTTTTTTTTKTTPVVPPPSVLVDPCAALHSENDDDPFLFAWSPECGAWVPTVALDRPYTHPSEPPRAWNTLDPSAASPLATRTLLHGMLVSCKRANAAMGRFDEALMACRLARRADPLDLDELRDEGALLVGVGRWAEGARALRGYLNVATQGGPPDRGWVEAEIGRAEAMAELEGLRARRAAEAQAEEEEGS